MNAMLKGKSLTQAQREIAALKPGDVWFSDHLITIEEFDQLTPEDTHAELFEGVIYMPQPNDEHEAVFVFLIALLTTYVSARGLGEVRGSRSGVKIDLYSMPQPDILFVRKRRRHIIERTGIVEPPDLVIEIVSSDTGRYRTLQRMSRYQQIGVPEYWYIDIPLKVARIYRLDDEGNYTITFQGSRGLMKSEAVPGFCIQARWLWSEIGNFPSTFSIVQDLVAGRMPR
jgi:Uma2 family endonuclease